MKIGLIPVNVGVPNVEAMVGMAQLAEGIGFESLLDLRARDRARRIPIKVSIQRRWQDGRRCRRKLRGPFDRSDCDRRQHEKRSGLVRASTFCRRPTRSTWQSRRRASTSFRMVASSSAWESAGSRKNFRRRGTPFERRGARFDDYIQAMRKIWSGDVVEHKSEFLDWTGFKSKPVPIQDPFPVVIGGTKGKAFERTAKYGNGWFAPTASPDQLSPMLEELAKACADEGRDRSEIEVTAMWFPNSTDLSDVERYTELGVSRLVVPVFALGKGKPADNLKAFGENVIAKLAIRS